jgi:AcrR family transcriptional regulator
VSLRDIRHVLFTALGIGGTPPTRPIEFDTLLKATNPRTGRSRSEDARQKVLWAVDDLLQEVGYAALTMKGIAERAGVGRQTVYRWWSTKAEILLDACMEDAQEELTIARTGDPLADLTTYLDALVHFLADSSAGAAYRAVIAAAQHDPKVTKLIAGQDVLDASARPCWATNVGNRPSPD